MKKVITYGTYDLFHEGHYRLLQRAKELGDYLIVGVTTRHFDEARGKVNVVDSIMDRIENVRATGFADEIIVEDHEGQKIEDIQEKGVDIFAIGSDWVGHFDYLKALCEVVYLERTPDISSTQIRESKFKIIRIGIIGTGRIAPRFVAESKYVSGANIVCAFNPEKESGEEFAATQGIKVYSRDLERFFSQVDAVYIASPNETHYDYACKAIEHGKHVLTEKPLAFNRAEAEELYHRAQERNLVLMEGVRAAYSPGFQQLMNVAMSGKIGQIRDIEACITRLAFPDSREMSDARYGGAFMEYGSYVMLPILKIFGTEYEDIRFDTIRDENGVDIYTKVNLRYPNGLATTKTGLGVKSEGQLVIAGTKGYVLAESPWWLTRRFDVRYEDPNVIEHYEPVFQGEGFRYEISEFVKKCNGQYGEGYKITSQESIAMCGIVEQFLNAGE